MLVAVNFHYVRPTFSGPYPGIHGVTPGALEAQLRVLGALGEFVSGEEIRPAVEDRAALPERALLVTFDDGARDRASGGGDLGAGDGPGSELGTKALMAGLQLLPQALSAYAAGRLTSMPQDHLRGRVFRRADFGAEAVCRMWRNFETGMMAEYARDIAPRCAARPIVGLAT
jgi:hypothetical protein